ncbi:MAG TPA: DNA mismatch repair protein MutS [Acholeplasmataceae bacterium]|nr:DNA mismatch repair protein MutS [Acholeplasmataceae bacterium]
MSDYSKFTPMMQQYLKIKEDYADAIVFFRLGDFYEMFFDDAIVASKVLEIALTKKEAGQTVPMCGVPHHAAKVYIQKLIAKGFKIAIVEQTSEPGKGLVEREVVQLITPGMIIDDDILPSNEYNFIGSISLAEYGYILSYADISTGDTFILNGLTKQGLLDEISNLKLKEVVLTNTADTAIINFFNDHNILVSIYTDNQVYNQKLVKNVKEKDQKEAASLLINYLEKESKLELSHLLPFETIQMDQYMRLDRQVLEHLELTQSLTQNAKSTLIHWIDKTHTSMGSRLLRYELTHPLKDKGLLETRYDYIEAFSNFEPRQKLENLLDQVYDINRLIGRISSNQAHARDLVQLKNTLKLLPEFKEALVSFKDEKIDELNAKIDDFNALYNLLEQAIMDEPPLTIKEGGIIKDGYQKDLDDLRNISTHGDAWLEKFELEEKQRTGIKNLKIGYNRVFGYYIEVTKGNMGLIQDEWGYIRKQTLANAERYITDELKQAESKILTAKEKADKLEYELFIEIKDQTKVYTHELQILSQIIAQIDKYIALSKVAQNYQYVRPKLNTNRIVDIEHGRHPVVEQHVEFIKNHIHMKPDETFILTGPNMSGKSTYMRMFAVIVVMAQTGMFVPATSANIPIYDAIFTRIGASDDIAGGQSTFMVEMVEANEALTYATQNSLILFDEIGRGTATYDGLALAQAMIEYVHTKIKAQMMFSTHYHELTKLAEKHPLITNLHVKAIEQKDHMVFLHQVELGSSDKSYGIQVAALAHLPDTVIKRAKYLLKNLEQNGKDIDHNLFIYEEKQELEQVIPHHIQDLLDQLNDLNIDQLTPLDALIKLKYLQSLSKKNTKE